MSSAGHGSVTPSVAADHLVEEVGRAAGHARAQRAGLGGGALRPGLAGAERALALVADDQHVRLLVQPLQHRRDRARRQDVGDVDEPHVVAGRRLEPWRGVRPAPRGARRAAADPQRPARRAARPSDPGTHRRRRRAPRPPRPRARPHALLDVGLLAVDDDDDAQRRHRRGRTGAASRSMGLPSYPVE